MREPLNPFVLERIKDALVLMDVAATSKNAAIAYDLLAAHFLR